MILQQGRQHLGIGSGIFDRHPHLAEVRLEGGGTRREDREGSGTFECGGEAGCFYCGDERAEVILTRCDDDHVAVRGAHDPYGRGSSSTSRHE